MFFVSKPCGCSNMRCPWYWRKMRGTMFKRSLASIELEQIARRLNFVRRANGLKTALMLGSRAGGLFRRPALQNLGQAFAPPELQPHTDYTQLSRHFRQ